MENTIITFIDHIGRTMIGTLDSQTETQIVVHNPAIVHVQPTQQGQLNVQTIPLFFKEFVGAKNKLEGTKWAFNKAQIAIGIDVENDTRLLQQYQAVFAPTATPSANAEPKIVKLFDE
jgi:hypothetical protein